MKPWTITGSPEQIDVVAPDGTVRSSVLAYFGGSHFFVEDMNVDVQAGDEIRRPLPNGKEQAFLVADPTCFTGGPFGPHYQIKISPKGTFDKRQGGHYLVTVSGENSRVNIGSHDASINVVVSGKVFDDIRQALRGANISQEQLDVLNKRISAMEVANDKDSFLSAYQNFVGSLADHITVVAPMLPALTAVLTGLPA